MAKKEVFNLNNYIKEDDKREKITLLISAKNKEFIKKNKINASKLIDDFLTLTFQSNDGMMG